MIQPALVNRAIRSVVGGFVSCDSSLRSQLRRLAVASQFTPSSCSQPNQGSCLNLQRLLPCLPFFSVAIEPSAADAVTAVSLQFSLLAALVELGNKPGSQHAENETLGGTTRHGKPTKQAPSLRDASKCQGSKTCACGASDSAGSGVQDRWCMHTEENCRTALQGAVFRRSWLCARHLSGTSINGAARLCSPTYRVHPLLGGQDAMPVVAP